jgi:DNA-binding transcriptional regulator LsrR (DeoR family)
MKTDKSLLVRIASLYYEHGINQNEISEICQIERSRISRLLLQARNLGLVQFQVMDPSNRANELCESLEQKYPIKEAVVFNTLNIAEHQLKKTIGLVAADYLVSTLKEGDIFAVSWGETIYYSVHGLETDTPRNLIVVPAVGGSGLISPAYQINDIARTVVNKIGGINRTLYAPAFVDSKQTRDAFMQSRDIQTVVDLWKSVTVALVGIGKSPFSYGSQPKSGLQFGQFYLKASEQEELLEMDVAGDINAHFFGPEGNELAASIHERVIGMSLGELKRLPMVIGVAGGEGKVESIRAALMGGNLDVLITDALTAQLLAV